MNLHNDAENTQFDCRSSDLRKHVKHWYLGLDIGTNSVGFSATDREYTILTKGGKLQCGARLFEDAEDASTRRKFRSSRRRFARRKVRIDLLQELFNEEIAGKDPAFFIRLNESSLHLEDKSAGEKYPLFTDRNFTDREYYRRFPTIWHLRKHLRENDETDIRLLYLACHHLVKYRGHFLFAEFNSGRSDSSYGKIIDDINKFMPDNDLAFDTAHVGKIPGIVADRSKSSAKQWDDISKILNPGNDKMLGSIFSAIRGNKIRLSKIWNDLDDAEKELKDELKDFQFSSEKYEECLLLAETVLNDEQLEFIALLKSFYDLVMLDSVMAGASSISEAMVMRWQEHKDELKLLKTFIKTHLPSEYDSMFRKNTEYKDKGFAHASYANYIGSNIAHGKKSLSHFVMCAAKGREPVTASHEEFLKYVGAVLEKAKNKDGYSALKEKIENKTLCRIHNTQDNSYIPHQLNKEELRAILERQKNNFMFLGNADSYSSVSDKIISLLTFRIPYYVGPLSDKDKGRFAWIEKRQGQEKVKVTPWNFVEVVDTAACGETFITRMTAKCTWLKSEDVIPKQSLLYQKYMLLNELNNLKLNGNRIDQDMKQFLYNGICQKETSLSKAKIKKYLVDHGKIQRTDTVGQESENDAAFHASLASLIKFRSILGSKIDERMCEDIIKWHTIFGDEKTPVRRKIEASYRSRLNDDQLEKLVKLTFKGWSRFSGKFLEGIAAADKKTGETLTIIRLLEDTTLNLMEILNSKACEPAFLETVEKENAGGNPALDYDGLVKGLYCSPTVKRSIWQAMLICRELKKINGSAPEKVFIEVTRGKDKKQKGKMKTSRRERIKALLNQAARDCADITAMKRELDNRPDEKEFRSDRLYLYFTQLGKCMYSGEAISLADLNNDNLYDIDHIYPQSKIKDDSMTNRVLVKRSLNAARGNNYPLDPRIQSERREFWSCLRDKGFISAEKYSRLICTHPLSADIIGGFINRQLVSTNQAVKETAKALKFLFGDATKIIYSKAASVSEFRHTHDLVKCREVNNLHHAHDAYLNIVVGNVWDSVYADYWSNNRTFNENRALDTLFAADIKGVWQITHIKKIREYLFDNRKYLNKYVVTVRPFEKKGAFYDQTIHPKGKGQYELKKGSDTKKYGGYKNGCNAYNCVMEYDKTKGKNGKPARIRGVFPVPVRFVGRYSDAALVEAIAAENDLGNQNPTLLMPKIKMFSVLEIDGVRYHMRSGDLQCSATAEWQPDKNIISIIHDIFRYLKLVSEKQLEADKDTGEDIPFATRERNRHGQASKTIRREDNLKVYDAIMAQIHKPFYTGYGFAKKVKEGKISRDKFRALKTWEQLEQLKQLLNFITMNGAAANGLEKIGGAIEEKCKYLVRGTINDKAVAVIAQSVTGLFESRAWITSPK
ncbi:MAG: type II CRISPR RNA-guided endonuclease Cas9 [Deltaproteobacteria bacterium]|jgi:CRISPR-associated endonuclease Csn1|nr:type II CRISPR RNA-guided endonuclease Cas9 [Deltaproteobacteria bacterium]